MHYLNIQNTLFKFNFEDKLIIKVAILYNKIIRYYLNMYINIKEKLININIFLFTYFFENKNKFR